MNERFLAVKALAGKSVLHHSDGAPYHEEEALRCASGGIMIGSITDLLFGCPHRRLTRPVTPVTKAGVPQGDTYVVCLDCAQQFAYDFKEMRMGKRIDRLKESGVLHPEMPMPAKKKLKYALWLSVPAALLLGTVLKSNKRRASSKPSATGESNSTPNEPR